MIEPRPELTLRRPERVSAWASLSFRALAVLALFGMALAGHWFDREGLKDQIDGHVSFTDAVYFTAITVTTVGYGDIVPVSDRARMFDTFVVTPIRLFVWLIFLGTAYSLVLRRTWERIVMRQIQQGLSGHSIVCGYGVTGEAAMAELIHAGVPASRIVVIDPHPDRVAAAIECGATGLEGDASRNATLEAAKLPSARALLICTGRDDTAALVALTARQLAPDVRISALVRARENEDLLRQAGADVVINPVNLGGQLLARGAGSSHVVDYVADLVSNDGPVCLRERSVAMGEVGKRLSEIDTGLAVRIHREGRTIGFRQGATLETGDTIIEIVRVAEA